MVHVCVVFYTDHLGNHDFEYKIFLAPSANLMTSQAAGCNIVPIGVTGTSSSNLGVTDQAISYEESTCWSSLYGSLGCLIFG